MPKPEGSVTRPRMVAVFGSGTLWLSSICCACAPAVKINDTSKPTQTRMPLFIIQVVSLAHGFPNQNGARSGLAAPRAELMSRLIGDLEGKLQCKFHYSSAALVLDLSEVIDRVLRKAESTS